MVIRTNVNEMVQFYVDHAAGGNDFEFKYIRVISIPTTCWEDKKFFKVSDIEEHDIGDERFKEIHFTMIRGKRAYRMVKIGRIIEKLSKGVDM